MTPPILLLNDACQRAPSPWSRSVPSIDAAGRFAAFRAGIKPLRFGLSLEGEQ
jgi:hypothetical protein